MAHPRRRAAGPARAPTAEKREAIRAAVDRALPPEREISTWSVRTMRAVKHAVELHRAVADAFSPAAPEAVAVAEALRHLVRGGHAFQKAEKRSAYHAARLASCDAVAALLLRGSPEAVGLVDTAESSLLPALAGLLRRSERSPRGGAR